ncbi:MAG: PH domain-containing protein [Pirellulaceae bacterium]
MICDNCQADIPDDSVYCPKCGDRMDRRLSPEAFPPAGVKEEAKAPAEGGPERLRDKLNQNRGDGEETEEELWEGGYSPKAMIGHWIGAGLLTVLLVVGMLAIPGMAAIPFAWIGLVVVLVLLWAGVGVLLLLRRLSVYYQLTSQRFIHKSGILSRTSDRIEVIDIDDVTFTQGLVERMVNVGTITITSSDRSHPELRMAGIDDVQKVADIIDTVRRAERRRRGVHIEAI